MNLNPHRPWITPLVIGTFVLMAVTGSLMFFHLDSGLNKAAHEWLGWAMVIAVVLHALMNLNADYYIVGDFKEVIPALEKALG